MFVRFLKINETERGAQCNRAIMIVTDGAPSSNYMEWFAKYNLPNKEVSVNYWLLLFSELMRYRSLTFLFNF
jgi:hypothetical protein